MSALISVKRKWDELKSWSRVIGTVSCTCLISSWAYKEWNHYKEFVEKETTFRNTSPRLEMDRLYNSFHYEEILDAIDFMPLDNLQYWFDKMFLSHNIQEIKQSDMIQFLEYITTPHKTDEDVLKSKEWVHIAIQKLIQKGWVFYPEDVSSNCEKKRVNHFQHYMDTHPQNNFTLRVPWIFQLCMDRNEKQLLESFESQYKFTRTIYKDCPLWHRRYEENKGKRSLLICTGILGSALQHHDISKLFDSIYSQHYEQVVFIIFPGCFLSPKAMYNDNERATSPHMDQCEFVCRVMEFLESLSIHHVDILAWSYGGIISSILQHNNPFKLQVYRHILCEPSGHLLSCLMGYIITMSPDITSNIYENMHLSNDDLKGYARLVLFSAAFKISSIVNCVKHHLMFRNLEWGALWNNTQTYFLLSDKDEIVPLHHGGLEFMQHLFPKAHFFIHSGNHGDWIKNELCVGRVKKLLEDSDHLTL